MTIKELIIKLNALPESAKNKTATVFTPAVEETWKDGHDTYEFIGFENSHISPCIEEEDKIVILNTLN